MKNKKNNIFLNFFGLISILLVGFFALVLINKINFSNSENLTPKSGTGNLNNVKEEKIKTTTILLAGRGGYGNDAPDLTDTMILVKINAEKKAISLLSIPRDLYVKFPTRGVGKLNSIYATYFYRNKDKFSGMQMLKQKITEITGEEIDYFVNADFSGFRKTIDALGGIEIDVEKKLVDYKYPTSNWGYKTIIFEKGIQNLDGERALQYARSRHSTSDYDRSLRQQQVIKAIEEKIKFKFFNKNQSVAKYSKNITNLYNIFKENVFTDISVTDAIKILVDTQILSGNFKFVSANMNDSCYLGAIKCEKGGIVYNPDISVFGTSVAVFSNTNPGNISNFELSKKYSQIVLNYPKIGEENYLVNIFNSTKRTGLATNMNYLIKRYGFNIPNIDFSGNTENVYEKSVIYYNSISENSETIQALKTLFDGEFIKTEVPKYSKNNAKIEIILGSDYLKNKKIFNF